MKKLLLLLCLAAGLSSRCQGASEFTVSLSGDPIYYGQGSFSLDGNSLSYILRTDPAGFDRAEVRGPAALDETAPVLYNLYLIRCVAPIGSEFGYCSFEGSLNISASEALDLKNGSWYINSYFRADPNRFIRGQITAVPEPSAWMLAVLGAGVGWLVCRSKSVG